MGLFPLLLSIIYFPILFLASWEQSRKRKIHFLIALPLIASFIGLFIVFNRPLRNPIGCKWCNNKDNEAVFCGLCGKNDAGDFRPDIDKKIQLDLN